MPVNLPLLRSQMRVVLTTFSSNVLKNSTSSSDVVVRGSDHTYAVRYAFSFSFCARSSAEICGSMGAARRLAMNSFDGRFEFGSPLAAARRSASQ